MATFYGVWIGKVPGVYDNWNDCKAQVEKYPKAQYSKLKSQNQKEALVEFENLKEEKLALSGNNNTVNNSSINKSNNIATVNVKPTEEVLTVDGASNGKNCEFQAVWYPSGKKAFSSKVFDGGTNNIAEFLGLVLAIKHLKDKELPLIVYTDSVTAISWVRGKKANTTARSTGKLTSELDNLLKKTEQFLVNNNDLMKKVKIMKWETKEWGEIPADFGRK